MLVQYTCTPRAIHLHERTEILLGTSTGEGDSRAVGKAIRSWSTASTSTLTRWFDGARQLPREQLHWTSASRRSIADSPHPTRVTVEDPKVFRGPWRMSMILSPPRNTNVQLLEYDCYAFGNPFRAQIRDRERMSRRRHYDPDQSLVRCEHR